MEPDIVPMLENSYLPRRGAGVVCQLVGKDPVVAFDGICIRNSAYQTDLHEFSTQGKYSKP